MPAKRRTNIGQSAIKQEVRTPKYKMRVEKSKKQYTRKGKSIGGWDNV